MNASETLDKAHLLVIQTLDDLPHIEWDMPGVCGNWSVKDIVAHLASYEHLLVDTLNVFHGKEASPSLKEFSQNQAQFNEKEVEARKYETAQHVLDEYNDLQLQSTSLLNELPAEKITQQGTMQWLRPDASLADMIDVVAEHTRQHCEQIAAFRDKVHK